MLAFTVHSGSNCSIQVKFSHFSTTLTENASQDERLTNNRVDTSLDNETKAKKIKNLKKKIRQIDEIQSKLDSKEIKELAIEQQEKLARKEMYVKELQQLEEKL